jgi:hypothetical protein
VTTTLDALKAALGVARTVRHGGLPMSDTLTRDASYLLPNETLYICGSSYIGLRDDVPATCWGCTGLKALNRHPCHVYMMPCQKSKGNHR